MAEICFVLYSCNVESTNEAKIVGSIICRFHMLFFLIGNLKQRTKIGLA